ncbi:hypothetical protein NFJ07_25555, partial [Arthrobacter sp. B2a2-09]|uniref:hypothetical protein n=1 Tax=Arthrobacter sp. B2a2-09 TaxID=2952822 RepID=UPI0022CDA502
SGSLYPPGLTQTSKEQFGMGKKYEYWTVKDGEDFAINLEIVSFTSTKGSFSSQASDPDEYFGSQGLEWKATEPTDWMSESEIASMEEWLANEHSEYLADLDYFD